jgi:hypothetical protein
MITEARRRAAMPVSPASYSTADRVAVSQAEPARAGHSLVGGLSRPRRAGRAGDRMPLAVRTLI